MSEQTNADKDWMVALRQEYFKSRLKDFRDVEPEVTQHSTSRTWEKSVEFAFAKWLSLSKLHAALTDPSVDDADLRKLVEETWHANSYIPLSGKAEKWIGDALGKLPSNDFCVFECKGRLNKEAWCREALPEERGADNTTVGNHGGKDRSATAKLLGPAAMAIGERCHYIVGYSDATISCSSYWGFIRHFKGDHNNPLPLIKNLYSLQGVTLPELKEYVTALVDPQKGNRKGAEFLFLKKNGSTWESWITDIEGLHFALSPELTPSQLHKPSQYVQVKGPDLDYGY